MWRGGTTQIPYPLSSKMGRLPPCKWLSFLFPLTFPVKLQCLYDGIFNLLRRRPRRKVFTDTFFRNFELLFLIGLLIMVPRK